jgi:hypothetical protein
MKLEKAPSGRAGRELVMMNRKQDKPASRAKLDRDWRHEHDKQKIVMFLIQVVKQRVYNIDAVIEAMVECADYFSFVELTSRERRALQGKLLRFVVALKV